MNDMRDLEAVESYILNSKYRSGVLEHLAGTVRATPKEISDSVDVSRPHISRALTELQEKGVVELRVPEERTVGRYYGLTEKGEEAWPKIKEQIRSVEWTIEDPSTPAMRSFIEKSKERFGEHLRCVGMYDGDVVTIFHIDPDVRASYSDTEFEDGLRTLIFDHSLDEASIQSDECWSDMLHFSEFSVLRVRVLEGSKVAISFDRGQVEPVPSFAESIASIFDT